MRNSGGRFAGLFHYLGGRPTKRRAHSRGSLPVMVNFGDDPVRFGMGSGGRIFGATTVACRASGPE